MVQNNNNVYTHEEAYEASLKYFHGDELAARVWVNKITETHRTSQCSSS